jgi:hypothetical protein
MDFTPPRPYRPAPERAMRYRIELSRTRKGFARIQLPGRELALEAKQKSGSDWEVAVSEVSGPRSGSIELRAADDTDAVWRVARAAVRAVSELTGSPIEEDLSSDPQPLRSE